MSDLCVDFSRIVLDLRREYGSVSRLARELGCKSPDMLYRLANGDVTEPPFTVGVSLVGQHQLKFGGPVPRVGDQVQRPLL